MEHTRLLDPGRRYLSDISPIVSETDDSITIRQPVRYYGAHSINYTESTSPQQEQSRALVSRYKYYSKLDSRRASSLLMPNHVVPPEFYLILPIDPPDHKQSSLVTIFSIWNTMMGTSILSIPWAIEQSGFVNAMIIMLLMAVLTLYTAYLVLRSPNYVPEDVQILEFSDVCRHFLGRWGEWISIAFSVLALVGAATVYWVLMTNFLYNSVTFIYHEAKHDFSNDTFTPLSNYSYMSDVYCPQLPFTPLQPNFTSTALTSQAQGSSIFSQVWHQQHTVPLFLLVVMIPLLNFRSPTFFTKFNALGTVSVLYVIGFVTYKAAKWGFHMDFNGAATGEPIHLFRASFPVLTGMMSLAYFIHNCVISILRNQRHPENNGRDLGIAYGCVAGTYLLVGALFFCAFPITKRCIQDNLLNNLRASDVSAFVARLFLLFQMITVFPLLLYVLRAQLLHTLFQDPYPSLGHVFVLNLIVLAICVLFAVFLPQIGTIIRFSGALCGLVYIFALPCLVHLIVRRRAGTLTLPTAVSHVVIIILGVVNLVAQFVVT